MRPVHSLVAEVLGELVHGLEATHDQPFEIKLVRDPQVQGHVEGVVVGDERTRRRTARNGLQDRGLHLQVATLVEEFTYRIGHAGPFYEGLLHVVVDHEVDVTLPVAHLCIAEGIVCLSVCVHLHDGHGLQRLGEQGQLFDHDGLLPHLGAEHLATDPDDVSYVEQFLEHLVVHDLVLARAKLVTIDVDLHPAGGVLELGERGLAHDPSAHDPAREDHLLPDEGIKVTQHLAHGRSGPELCRGIGVDAQLPQALQRLAPHDFLFR